MKKILPVLMLGVIWSGNASAWCDSFYCFVDNMPHYDQNGDGVYSKWHLNADSKTTNLCVPTSFSMMTQTMLNNHSEINWSKNVDQVHSSPTRNMWASTYKITSPAHKIDFTAYVIDTSKENGSYKEPAKNYIQETPDLFKNVWVFFPGGRSQYNNDMGVSVNTLKSNSVNKGATAAAYVNYGHYNRKLTNSYYGYNFYKIERGGGHGVAQRGYWGNYIYIYDPWFKNKYFTEIMNTYSGWDGLNYYTLPNGLSRVSVLKARHQDDSYWPIMETNGSFGKRKY